MVSSTFSTSEGLDNRQECRIAYHPVDARRLCIGPAPARMFIIYPSPPDCACSYIRPAFFIDELFDTSDVIRFFVEAPHNARREVGFTSPFFFYRVDEGFGKI